MNVFSSMLQCSPAISIVFKIWREKHLDDKRTDFGYSKDEGFCTGVTISEIRYSFGYAKLLPKESFFNRKPF